ncbi:MAG: hypothetical protein HUU22_06365 [Phycisphaerae bacterium]|nr:M14 family metallocarboxypeptidase [Phycisphaerae bacterium]NUQ45637.1 hypothetical protein [Phycisphaerae bacterium]
MNQPHHRTTTVTAAVLSLLLSAATLLAQPVRFEDDRVVRVHVATADHLDKLLTVTDDVWSESIGFGGPLDVRITPDRYPRFLDLNLPHSVLIDNVQAVIDAQELQPRGDGAFDAYMTYDDVLAYMNTLVNLRPDLAQTFIVGQTLEGRDIVGLRITGPGGDPRPGVLYHGCTHAREWITVPTTLYVADRLVRDYDTDPYLQRLVNRVEWYLVPVFNADGFVYTHTNNRLWRKNRRDNGNGTFGVDINRNWGEGWGGPGSSGTPSNDTFRGTAPFSEPETAAMRDFLLAHPNIRAYNDIHSYSQLILWPWGYQSTYIPDDAEYRAVGATLADIIFNVHGRSYIGGPPWEILYLASGVSVDWVYVNSVAMPYSYELRDTGQYGFLLPPDQILPTCEEIFPTLTYLTDYTTTPVRIEYPNGLPAALAPGAATPLQIRITANLDAVDPAGAVLHVGPAPGGPFTTYPITHVGGDEFLATLPSRPCGDPLEFYVTAAGMNGDVAVSPPGAPAATHAIPVGVYSLAFDDNFESDLGWTVENIAVTSGAWVRVDPVGTLQNQAPAQPEDDNPYGVGTMCYVTGQGVPGGAVGAADLDGGPTRLISPLLDLSGLSDPTISYYRWFYNDDGDDFLTVEISNDDGQTWVTLESTGHDPGWKQRSFRVLDFITLTDQVRLRFSAADNPNNSITEAAVDDVAIFDYTCVDSIVLGDMNCDGVLNADDVAPFALALIDPDAYADAFPGCNILRGDLTADSATDGEDIDAFLRALLSAP